MKAPALSASFGIVLLVAAFVAGPVSFAADERKRAPKRAEVERDMRFAAEMASKGLWREALYRWERVLRTRPDDARLINNIAVAREALGEFDRAAGLYEKASLLEGAPPEVIANADLFRTARIDREERARSAEGIPDGTSASDTPETPRAREQPAEDGSNGSDEPPGRTNGGGGAGA